MEQNSGWCECFASSTGFHFSTSQLWWRNFKIISYSSGSLKACILQEEMDKMSEKSALEEVEYPGLGFYSSLFPVQKAPRGWRPVISLSFLRHFVNITKFKMETVSSWDRLERRHDIFYRLEGCQLPYTSICSTPLSRWLISHNRLIPSSSGIPWAPSSLSRPGDCHQLGEIRSQADPQGTVFQKSFHSTSTAFYMKNIACRFMETYP